MFITPYTTEFGLLIYVLLFFGLYVTVLLFLLFLDNVGELEKKHNKKVVSNVLGGLTVLIPAYNESSIIEKCVEDALKLNYSDLKVLVVDDGSTDDTANIVRNLGGENVEVITKINSGKAASVNFGLEKITSPYVLIMDADTRIHSDAAGIMMDYLQNNSEAIAVVPTVQILEPNSFIERIQVVEYSLGNFFRRMFASINSFSLVPACVLAERKDLLNLGGFNEDTLTEDLEMGLRIKANHRQILHATEAKAFTKAPNTFDVLQKQRLRWQYGGYENIIKYRKFMFNRKYGDFGVFGFPVFVLSRFVTLTFFLLIIQGFISELLRQLRLIYWGGLESYLLRIFSTPTFHIPSTPSTYILVFGFLFNIAFFYIALKYTSVKADLGTFLVYVFLFWMVFAYFSFKALLLFLIRHPPGWKAIS